MKSDWKRVLTQEGEEKKEEKKEGEGEKKEDGEKKEEKKVTYPMKKKNQNPFEDGEKTEAKPTEINTVEAKKPEGGGILWIQ